MYNFSNLCAKIQFFANDFSDVYLHFRLIRSCIFSSGVVLGYTVSMRALITHFYTLALSLWVGGLFLFTFVVTPVIFKSYDRDMAGEIVGKLFPSYFLFSVVISVLSLVFFLISSQDKAASGHSLSLFLLIAAVLLSLYVSVRLHPEIKRVKQEIASFEAAAPDDPLRKKFRSLHAQSAILNILMLTDGVALLLISSRFSR
jgi:uncharacterized membrane protein